MKPFANYAVERTQSIKSALACSKAGAEYWQEALERDGHGAIAVVRNADTGRFCLRNGRVYISDIKNLNDDDAPGASADRADRYYSDRLGY